MLFPSSGPGVRRGRCFGTYVTRSHVQLVKSPGYGPEDLSRPCIPALSRTGTRAKRTVAAKRTHFDRQSFNCALSFSESDRNDIDSVRAELHSFIQMMQSQMLYECADRLSESVEPMANLQQEVTDQDTEEYSKLFQHDFNSLQIEQISTEDVRYTAVIIADLGSKICSNEDFSITVAVEPPYRFILIGESFLKYFRFEGKDLLASSLRVLFGPETDQHVVRSLVAGRCGLSRIPMVLYRRDGEEIRCTARALPKIHGQDDACTLEFELAAATLGTVLHATSSTSSQPCASFASDPLLSCCQPTAFAPSSPWTAASTPSSAAASAALLSKMLPAAGSMADSDSASGVAFAAFAAAAAGRPAAAGPVEAAFGRAVAIHMRAVRRAAAASSAAAAAAGISRHLAPVAEGDW
jgi:hypothetical protein